MTSEPLHHRSRRSADPNTRRGAILGVVAAALIVGGVVDRVGGPAAGPPAPVVQPVPVAAPAGALSSSWFCAGATDSRTGSAPASVVIANGGTATVSGEVTIVSGGGASRTQSLRVGSQSSVLVPETVPGGAPWVGAIVDVDGGTVAVDQLVTSPLGQSAVPCATSGSAHWYFPAGMTLINADETISLLNPYPTDSIVDLSFSTSQGLEQPEDFQGLDVPKDGLLTVDLRSHLRRRAAIATTVTARTGNVIAWETESATPPARGAVIVGSAAARNPLSDPAWPVPGVAVTLGSPSTGTTWVWPDGVAGNGFDERYVIYNPGPTTAEVRLSLTLQQGQAEPFDLSIGAGQVLPVVSEQQARIPAGVPHSAVLQSLNGVPVVAERVIASSKPPTGLSLLPGGRLRATNWLVPHVASDRHYRGELVLYNPGAQAARVTIMALVGGGPVALPGVAPLTVPAEQRVAVRLPLMSGGGGPVVVSATEPVFVESDYYARNGRTAGVSLSIGVPLAG